jgi:dCTP deaminase
MLLTFNDLERLVAQNVITADPRNINGASIDITLGADILLERPHAAPGRVVDLRAKDSPDLNPVTMGEDGYDIVPGQFLLAHSKEVFNLPDDIAAEYKLKSSLARAGLGHLLAGWADPWWNGSQLTLELKNETQFHTLRLRPGMKIGQVVFWKGAPVPRHAGYAEKGQYNGDLGAVGVKELK